MKLPPSRFAISPFAISLIAALTAMWCVLWGEVTVANVVSGAVLAALFVAIGSAESEGHAVRPIALVKFLALVAVDLAKSTVAVAVEVLTPTDRTDETIIVVDPAPEQLAAPLLMVVAITITPGTGVVDVDLESGRLYLHLLHGKRADEVVEQVRRLNRLANAALPRHEPIADQQKESMS